MTETLTRRLAGDVVGFPPGRRFLLMPRRPRRAFAAALALYEAVEPRQRALLSGARLAAASGLSRFLRPVPYPPPGLDVEWWQEWMEVVAREHVGPGVASAAFRLPPNGRAAVLLLDHRGRPLAFAKVVAKEPTSVQRKIAVLLDGGTSAFTTPRLLSEGALRGIPFRMYAPLPAGAHRRPPRDVSRVRAAIDAWQSRLESLPRPPGVDGRAVICHADFTPRNLRVASDRRWWLIDWDNARWGPRLADELHYWCADYAWRWRPQVEPAARAVFSLLRQRGTDHEILAAVRWPDAPERTYRPAEQTLRARVGALAGTGRQ